MDKEYIVERMTCNGCVASVKKSLDNLEGVVDAQVRLESPQAKVRMSNDIPIEKLQEAIGHYTIKAFKPIPDVTNETSDLPEKSLTTYQPLLLIIGFTLGTTLLVQYPFTEFSWMLWMRHFMAGFFIVFSFFKFLNLQGFADSYSMYDIVAGEWKPWGFIYPFVELILGIMYLIHLFPFWTNLATIIILTISSIGVIKSNLDKRKIKCACLGDVFNLPMSTVTIIEDVSMVLMAGIMLFLT